MTSLTDTQVFRSKLMETTCVLLIEDDELIQARLEMVIEAAGYGIFSAGTAAEAREVLRVITFPMVIVDRMLPDADGVELCKEIRRLSVPNRIFITLLSACDTQEDISAGLAAGADDYLSKRGGEVQLLDRLYHSISKIRLGMK